MEKHLGEIISSIFNEIKDNEIETDYYSKKLGYAVIPTKDGLVYDPSFYAGCQMDSYIVSFEDNEERRKHLISINNKSLSCISVSSPEKKQHNNHIAALAFAMQAKRKYRFASRADFVHETITNHPHWKCKDEKKCLSAMNDLLKKNNSGDFTHIIRDQASMIKFIEGCYKKTKRGKESDTCSDMKAKANDYLKTMSLL